MAKRKHVNAEDRLNPFLSQSRGEVTVETPDCTMTPDYSIFSHVDSPSQSYQDMGNRGGRGKTLTVK